MVSVDANLPGKPGLGKDRKLHSAAGRSKRRRGRREIVVFSILNKFRGEIKKTERERTRVFF